MNEFSCSSSLNDALLNETSGSNICSDCTDPCYLADSCYCICMSFRYTHALPSSDPSDIELTYKLCISLLFRLAVYAGLGKLFYPPSQLEDELEVLCCIPPKFPSYLSFGRLYRVVRDTVRASNSSQLFSLSLH